MGGQRVRDLANRVEGAGVHIAGLRGHDHRPIDLPDDGARLVRDHPTLVVGRDARDPVAAEP